MSCLFYTFILMNAFNMFKSLKIFKLQFVKFPPLKYMYIFSSKLQVYYITIYAINLCQKCDSQAVLILSTRQERWLCTWLEIQDWSGFESQSGSSCFRPSRYTQKSVKKSNKIRYELFMNPRMVSWVGQY